MESRTYHPFPEIRKRKRPRELLRPVSRLVTNRQASRKTLLRTLSPQTASESVEVQRKLVKRQFKTMSIYLSPRKADLC